MKTRYSSGRVTTHGLVVGALAAVFGIAPGLAFASTIDISYFTSSGCSGSAAGGTAVGFGGCSTTVNAEADLDTLKLNLESVFAGLDGSSATVRVQDMITVSGGTGAGTIVFDWEFDGSLTASDGYYSTLYMSNLGGGAFAGFTACGDSVNVALVCVADLVGPYAPATDTTTVSNQVRSITIPFTFDVPFAVDWRLTAVIQNRCVEFNSCPAIGTPTQPGGGEVQFGNTLQLQPLLVLDAAGGQVASATVSSDSRVQYAVAAPVAVPEPSLLALLSGGLLTVFGLRLRRG